MQKIGGSVFDLEDVERLIMEKEETLFTEDNVLKEDVLNNLIKTAQKEKPHFFIAEHKLSKGSPPNHEGQRNEIDPTVKEKQRRATISQTHKLFK